MKPLWWSMLKVPSNYLNVTNKSFSEFFNSYNDVIYAANFKRCHADGSNMIPKMPFMYTAQPKCWSAPLLMTV